MNAIEINNPVVDSNLGASNARGTEYACFAQIVLDEVLRAEKNRIDFSCKKISEVIYASMWTHDEQSANYMANVMRQNAGKPIPQIWTMDVRPD